MGVGTKFPVDNAGKQKMTKRAEVTRGKGNGNLMTSSTFFYDDSAPHTLSKLTEKAARSARLRIP